jgi:hypothetical protein
MAQNSETEANLDLENFWKNRFDINANFTTKNWDINDLGFSTTTNIAIIMLGMDIEFYNQPKDSIIFI